MTTIRTPSDTALTAGRVWLPKTSQDLMNNDYLFSGAMGELCVNVESYGSGASPAWSTVWTVPFQFPDWAEDDSLNENLRLVIRVSYEHRVSSGSGGYTFRLNFDGTTGTPSTPSTSGSYAWDAVSVTLDTTDTWPTGADTVDLEMDYGVGAGNTMQLRREPGGGYVDCGWYVYEV